MRVFQQFDYYRPNQDDFKDLQQLLGQANGNDACRAAHAREVVGNDVGIKFEVVDNHGGQRRRRVEQATIHHQNIDLHEARKL